MSEQTYTRVVQALILFVVVVGAFYAEPAASAIERGRHGYAAAGITQEAQPCLC